MEYRTCIGNFSLLQATLTLPGIAGLILTVGMSIDANVIIFERIREELDKGKTAKAAIDGGYNRALTTIIDANMTTLIAALVYGNLALDQSGVCYRLILGYPHINVHCNFCN
ncbi:MAG: hypothetical protein Ct9H90mP20_3370 [Candidatus Neomarinimicrobiota bacterium]|nr:MAG: hypothetical protein Ct9H90mP20_3370 [Candidatus Neomarinimicrobiota bacterium]